MEGVERGLTDIALALAQDAAPPISVNAVARNLMIKTGSASTLINSEVDTVVNTGVPNFPSGLTAGGFVKVWPNSTWNMQLRGYEVRNGSSGNIELVLHFYTAAAQNIDVNWWAIGF